MSRIVYLDGHATTPLAPEAAEVMASLWSARAGNAQSPHIRGQEAAAAVELGRRQVAQLIGAAPQEIVFTSGATEANNIILLGVADAARRSAGSRNKIVATAIEHKSVLAALEALSDRGFEVALAPVTTHGLVDLEVLAELVDDRTLLVSVMGANNEIGVLQPLEAVVRLARDRGALVHSDLAQLAGKLPVDVVALDLDYASLSAHKLYGPMGVGAVFVSGLAAIKPRPLFFGGGQEGGLRPGTLPTPLIAGFGAAADVAAKSLLHDGTLQHQLAQRLLEGLERRQVRVIPNCVSATRLPGSLSLQFVGLDADELVGRLSADVCVSTGSACSAGQITVSHVLQAISLSGSEAVSTVRLYVDRYSSHADVDYAVDRISAVASTSPACHWTADPVESGHEVHSH